MSLKEAFGPEEWAVVTGAPYTVGTAVMMARFSGLGGTAQEAFSLARSMAEGHTGSDALIKEVTDPDEVSAAQTALRAKTKTLDPSMFKQQLNQMAADEATRAAGLVEQKAPGEAAAYKEWLMKTAFGVANASKEGDFLGIGGTRISKEEQETLDALSAALGIPVPAA